MGGGVCVCEYVCSFQGENDREKREVGIEKGAEKKEERNE